VNTKTRYQELLPPLWILSLLATFLLFWLAVQLKEILVLMVLGYSLAFVMEPAVTFFENKGVGKIKLGRSSAFFLIITLFTLAMVVLVLTAIPTISKEYDRLSTELPVYVEQAKTRLMPLIQQVEGFLPEKFRPKAVLESPSTLFQYISGDSIKKFFSAIFYTFLGGYSLTLTILNLLLLPFIVYYLSIDFPIVHRNALLLFPKEQRLPVLKIAKQINRDVSAFVSAQLLVGAILFILYFAGLWGIGLELALLLAVISGFGNIIPYVGSIIGITLSSVMALVTFGDWSHLIQVWALYGVVQFLEGSFITPRIMGQNVGLSPLVVLLALVVGGQLLGLLGLLLAIPLTAVIKVLLKEILLWITSREPLSE
jgi:predicted PurR-regulated permease PerM